MCFSYTREAFFYGESEEFLLRAILDITICGFINHHQVSGYTVQFFRRHEDNRPTTNFRLQIKRSRFHQDEKLLGLLRYVNEVISFEHVTNSQISQKIFTFRQMCGVWLNPNLMSKSTFCYKQWGQKYEKKCPCSSQRS